MKLQHEVTVLANAMAGSIVNETGAAGTIVIFLTPDGNLGIGGCINKNANDLISLFHNIVHLAEEMTTPTPTIAQTRSLQNELDAIIKKKH